MAFTQLTATVTNIGALADLPNDTDGLTATQLKAKFDKAGVDIKTFINDVLLAELEATTVDASGASKIGVETIGGITGNTVQAVLEFIVGLGVGGLPGDGTISDLKLATDVKVGSLATLTTTAKSSVVAAIIELVSAIATDTGNLSTHISDTTKHTDILSTQGDLLGHNGTTRIRVAKGTARQQLAMNSGATAQEYIDSPQKVLTTQGDLLITTGANTISRLAIGTAGQVLAVNSGATAQEYITPPVVAEGNFTGNGSNPRTITVGFRPKMVVVVQNRTTYVETAICLTGNVGAEFTTGVGTGFNTINKIQMESTGFTINSGSSLNINTYANYWFAIK